MKIKPMNDIEQSVEAYITDACGISYTVVCTGLQKRDKWECDGWRFTIKGQSFDYFTGIGHREIVRGFKAMSLPNAKHVNGNWQASRAQTPPIAGLLYSLISDGSACDESFASWCDNFGYDTDSRKALETYEQCQQGFDRLRKVLTGSQINHVRELLEDY